MVDPLTYFSISASRGSRISIISSDTPGSCDDRMPCLSPSKSITRGSKRHYVGIISVCEKLGDSRNNHRCEDNFVVSAQAIFLCRLLRPPHNKVV
jgi:hypothetical protein